MGSLRDEQSRGCEEAVRLKPMVFMCSDTKKLKYVLIFLYCLRIDAFQKEKALFFFSDHLGFNVACLYFLQLIHLTKSLCESLMILIEYILYRSDYIYVLSNHFSSEKEKKNGFVGFRPISAVKPLLSITEVSQSCSYQRSPSVIQAKITVGMSDLFWAVGGKLALTTRVLNNYSHFSLGYSVTASSFRV